VSFPKLEPITEETLTPEHVERVRRAILGVPRKNSLHRAILTDCAGVLAGNNACRETVVLAWNAMVAPSGLPVGAARSSCTACGEKGDDRVCPACEHDHGEPTSRPCCDACGEAGDDRVCPACEHDHGDRAVEDGQ
jgi:hypothetical protein